MPPKNAGRSLRSIFHTFLYRHMIYKRTWALLKSLFSCNSVQMRASEQYAPQSQARSMETPHHRRARPLSWRTSSEERSLYLLAATTWTLSKCAVLWMKAIVGLKTRGVLKFWTQSHVWPKSVSEFNLPWRTALTVVLQVNLCAGLQQISTHQTVLKITFTDREQCTQSQPLTCFPLLN